MQDASVLFVCAHDVGESRARVGLTWWLSSKVRRFNVIYVVAVFVVGPFGALGLKSRLYFAETFANFCRVFEDGNLFAVFVVCVEFRRAMASIFDHGGGNVLFWIAYLFLLLVVCWFDKACVDSRLRHRCAVTENLLRRDGPEPHSLVSRFEYLL